MPRYISLLLLLVAVFFVACKNGQSVKETKVPFSEIEKELRDSATIKYFNNEVVDTLNGRFILVKDKQTVMEAGYSGAVYDYFVSTLEKATKLRDSIEAANPGLRVHINYSKIE